MFCSKCGSTLSPGSAFCQVCGTPASTAVTQPASPISASGAAAIPAPVSAAGTVSPHWLPAASRAYAGFWLRVVAHFIDGLLLGVVVFAILIPVLMLTGLGSIVHSISADRQPDPAVIAALISSVSLLAAGSIVGSWLYSAYFESSDWQATVGKKVLNLVVTDLEGNRISFGRATGRFFAKFVTALIPLGIGYVLAGITEKKQALHDMIASCLVLRS